MSGIWGFVLKNEKSDSGDMSQLMRQAMSHCKFDRVDEISEESVYFACGHQHLTTEAKSDVSPIYDDTTDTFFLGDCFLYNRESLIEKLKGYYNRDSLKEKQREYQVAENLENAGDNQLAFLAYKALGKDFPLYLRGAFAFVIYERKAQKVHFYSEQLCKRYLAYHVMDEGVLFASIYNPITAVLGDGLKICRHFIISSYRDISPMNFYDNNLTPFEGVFHLEPGMHLTVDMKTLAVEKRQYYNPLKKVKKLKGLTDDQYRELFLETYSKVVKAHLRTCKEVGIMLSGGLDSASIAALAAPELAKEGKTLHSYTSVPCKAFESTNDGRVNEDESQYIYAQVEKFPNIVPKFVSGDDWNAFDGLKEQVELHQMPIKAAVNNANIFRMAKAAVEDGCGIVLSGGNGNTTVSYGDHISYISMEVLGGHPVKALKEMRALSRKYHRPTKVFVKSWLKSFIKDMFTTVEGTESLLYEEDAKKYGYYNFQADNQREFGKRYVCSEKQKQRYMYIPSQYMQNAFYFTTETVRTGFLFLDPTWTVELVELCLSLPNSCFVQDGVDRRMIKSYMKGILPDCLLDERKGHGVQCADFHFRINRDWDRIGDEIEAMLKNPKVREYLDSSTLDEILDTIKAEAGSLTWDPCFALGLVMPLGYFLQRFDR